MKFMSLCAASASLFALGAVVSAPVMAADPVAAAPAPKSPLDFTVNDIDGKPVELSKYKGDVVLIVNTATLCGYKAQIGVLETLYGKYKDKGLKILAFPANDFHAQEPGTDAQIKAVCTQNYKTTYDFFSKIVVKGDKQAPLYTYLTSKETDPKHSGDIQWNFTKFLIGRDGTIINRFPSVVDPMSPQMTVAVEDALAAPVPDPAK